MRTRTVAHRTAPQARKRVSQRKELLENAQVLVIETTYAPGGGVPKHVHRFPHLVYVVEGGSLETTGADGTVQTHEVYPGQTMWRTPQAHGTRNVGATPVHILEVEVKQPSRELWEQVPALLTSDVHGWTADPFDPRRSVALLVGDPTKPGPYTVRYRLPGGYTMGLHRHPEEDEQLTVLSGFLHWSSGEAGSGAPEYALAAGAFAPAPAGTPHRVWTTEECVIQLTGVGPRTYEYFSPADDPRGRRV